MADIIATATAGASRRAAAQALVDQRAEMARARFVTPGEIKQAIYGQKAVEADRLASDASPDAANYPLLAPEAAALGVTLVDLGATVRAKRDAWLAAAGQIEALCQVAKASIEGLPADAPASDYWTIIAAIAWPLPA
jgi:hypothetical protein